MAAKRGRSRGGGALSSAAKAVCDLVGLPASRQTKGTGVLVAVVEADGTKRNVAMRADKYSNGLPTGRAARKQDERLVQLFSALASPRRLTMLKAMLAGADSYAKLRKAVGLSAGPLYYHLRELRSAGLIEEGQRDVYRLTDRGKQLLLIADCTVSLLTQ